MTLAVELAELLAPLQAAAAQLEAILALPPAWLTRSPGPNHWSAAQAAAHMADIEELAWIPRVRHILQHGRTLPLPPVNPTGFMTRFPDLEPEAIGVAFRVARQANLDAVTGLDVEVQNLEQVGIHPRFGEVTLRQLLSTWVAHDFNHLGQIHESLAAGLRDAVGPWREFVPIVDRLG